MHLINPEVASSEAGGTPPDTPEQHYDRAPPFLRGGGGGGTSSDTVEQPCGVTSVSVANCFGARRGAEYLCQSSKIILIDCRQIGTST